MGYLSSISDYLPHRVSIGFRHLDSWEQIRHNAVEERHVEPQELRQVDVNNRSSGSPTDKRTEREVRGIRFVSSAALDARGPISVRYTDDKT